MAVESESTTSRRTFLRAGAATVGAAASIGTSGCLYIMGLRQREHRRRQIATQRQRLTGGSPISFASQRKRITRDMATVVVRTRAELVRAVQQPNAVVWLPGNVTIDMSGPSLNLIAPGVTIASNRNLNGGKGGLIKTSDYDERVFLAPEGTHRVTGIRLKGPLMQYFDPPNNQIYDYASSGIHFQGETAIIDNCEMMGWTAMAIGLGTRGTATQGWIHHNSMHHNQMNHLGYPMELYNGIHLIEWNYFSQYRHAITAFGYPSNGYEARFNVVGPPGGAPAGFAFDMHSLGEQSNFPDSNTTGGKFVNAHHNVFELTDHAALSLSGVPTQYARFCNNWCADSEGVVDGEPGADLRVKQNSFGAQAIVQGRKWLTQLASQIPLSDGVPSLAAWSLPGNLSPTDNSTTNTNTTTNANTTNTTKRT